MITVVPSSSQTGVRRTAAFVCMLAVYDKPLYRAVKLAIKSAFGI